MRWPAIGRELLELALELADSLTQAVAMKEMCIYISIYKNDDLSFSDSDMTFDGADRSVFWFLDSTMRYVQ